MRHHVGGVNLSHAYFRPPIKKSNGAHLTRSVAVFFLLSPARNSESCRPPAVAFFEIVAAGREPNGRIVGKKGKTVSLQVRQKVPKGLKDPIFGQQIETAKQQTFSVCRPPENKNLSPQVHLLWGFLLPFNKCFFFFSGEPVPKNTQNRWWRPVRSAAPSKKKKKKKNLRFPSNPRDHTGMAVRE